MLNRAALILRYKAPAVQWINDADPHKEDPGLTVESVNEERTVYLIRDEDAETEQAQKRWITRNYKALFEAELEGWYTDASLWPKNRSIKVFEAWFEVECHTILIDTVGDAIYDDGA